MAVLCRRSLSLSCIQDHLAENKSIGQSETWSGTGPSLVDSMELNTISKDKYRNNLTKAFIYIEIYE